MNAQSIRVLADLAAVTAAGRELFLEHAARAIRERGSFRVALSGGSTPKKLYEALVEASLDWSKVLVFFGDERCVPPEHADSNYRMVREALLSKVPIPSSNVHRIYAEIDDARTAAEEYEGELERVFELEPGAAPRFDLVLLGLGSDGHTASLFPGSSALGEERHLVTATWVERLEAFRVTFTARTINAAHAIVFLVAGADKAAALCGVLQGPRDPARLPAQLVARPDGPDGPDGTDGSGERASERGELVWLVDRAAAAELSS